MLMSRSGETTRSARGGIAAEHPAVQTLAVNLPIPKALWKRCGTHSFKLHLGRMKKAR